MNERLLRDGCETVALLGGLAGEPSSPAVRLWLEFADVPSERNWYRAHNASIVAGYLEHRDLADTESEPERFFMNVALVRVLYAHALDYTVIVPRLQRLYEWSALELAEPRLLALVRDGNPVYAWPFEQRHVWHKASMPFAARVLERATRAN